MLHSHHDALSTRLASEGDAVTTSKRCNPRRCTYVVCHRARTAECGRFAFSLVRGSVWNARQAKTSKLSETDALGWPNSNKR
jgi:hypothetical protein